MQWKSAAFSPGDNKTTTKEGVDVSVQNLDVEVVTCWIAVEKSSKEPPSVLYICPDSWALANVLCIWSSKWRETDFLITDKDVRSIGLNYLRLLFASWSNM